MSARLYQFDAVARHLSLGPPSPALRVQLSDCGDSRLLRICEDERCGLRVGYNYFPTATLVVYDPSAMPRVVDQFLGLLCDILGSADVHVVLTEIVVDECQRIFADEPCSLRHEWSESWPFRWPSPSMVVFARGRLELHIVLEDEGGVTAELVVGSRMVPLERWRDFPASSYARRFNEDAFRRTVRNIALWIRTRWTEVSAFAKEEFGCDVLEDCFPRADSTAPARAEIDFARLAVRSPTNDDIVVVGSRFTMCQWFDANGALHWAFYDDDHTDFAMPNGSSVALAGWRRYLKELCNDRRARASLPPVEKIMAGAKELLARVEPPMYPIWAEGSELGGPKATFSDGRTLLTILRRSYSLELEAEVIRQDAAGNLMAPAALVTLPEAARPLGLTPIKEAKLFAQRLVDNWSTVMRTAEEQPP